VYHVYILRCSDQSLYVGSTHNIERRVEAHNAGLGATCTFQRRPVTLVYMEPHDTMKDAVRPERQLKRWTRAKKEALIRGDLALLRTLSKRRN